jgi:Putative prokaryotic signal transducing protein
MKQKNKLVKVYTGTEVTVNLLKELLEETGVGSTIQNNYKSGVEIGFVGGVQSAIDLFIQQSDFETAEPLIRDFIEKNRS